MTDDPTSGSLPDEPAESGVQGNAAQEDERDERLRDLFRTASEADAVDPLGAIYAVRRRVRRRRFAEGALGGCLVAAALALAVIIPAGATGHRLGPVAVPGPPPTTVPPVPASVPPVPTSAPPARLTGALVSFGGCADYLDYVRSRALSEVGPYGLQSPEVRSLGFAEAAPSAGIASTGAAEGPAASPSASANSPEVSPGYSQTNDQVAGVDEPDTVKTDGSHVFTLTGPTLRVLDTSAHVVGSIDLQGDTSGGFLLDGAYAIVLSAPPPAISQPSAPVYSPSSQPQQPGTEMARAAVVDVSDPSHPTLLRTFLFDGSLVASRLVGDQVRLVDRTDGPRLAFVDPSTTGDETSAAAANRQLIAGSTLADWLPAWQSENPDGSVSARVPISSCDSVSRAEDATGISTVSVFVLDPKQSAPGPGTSVVAAGDTVYATADHLFVAGESEPTPLPATQSASVQYGCCTIVPPHGASTEIYEFDTPSSGQPTFVGSGSVPGWLLSSYAMDQAPNGLLRVATTEMTPTGSTDAQITILQRSAARLARVGSVGGLGSGEVIRAVRFIGNDAYVVTFRSFDPLYVVDMSDPAKPALVGELDQPGFSEFLYPLPGNRLLGVGVEITDNEPSGLVVATYDVSNPAKPSRIDSSELVSGLQYGLQAYDPHAFLYWAPTDLALIAVPSANEPQSGSGVAAYKIGAGGNLARAATLGHGTDLATRSLVINGEVWVVTTSGVVTAALNALPTSAWHPY